MIIAAIAGLLIASQFYNRIENQNDLYGGANPPKELPRLQPAPRKSLYMVFDFGPKEKLAHQNYEMKK